MPGPPLRRISTGSPQDLLRRTCARSFKDTERISPGPLQELRTRTCTRSCTSLWQHFTRISTRSSHKERSKTLALNKIFLPGLLGEVHKIVIKEPVAAGADLTRSWYRNLPRASHKSFHASTSSTWHLQGPLREDPTRIHKSPFMWEFKVKRRRPRAWESCGSDFVRSCDMHMEIWLEPFYARS